MTARNIEPPGLATGFAPPEDSNPPCRAGGAGRNCPVRRCAVCAKLAAISPA